MKLMNNFFFIVFFFYNIDNINLFNYSLESLSNYGYDIIYKTNDLDCLNENNIMTEYEKKFYNLGVKINKLEGIRKKED